MPRVSILDQSKSFEVNENEIIYDALSDRGEVLPHGCLSGSCGACKIEVCAGEENLSVIGPIEQNTIDSIKTEIRSKNLIPDIEKKIIRLACRAKINKGEVIIKPLKIT